MGYGAIAQQCYQPEAHSRAFPFSPDVFSGIFTLPFVHDGTHAMNCPGIAFLYAPSNSSSVFNSNNVLISFTCIGKMKYVNINVLTAP